MTLLSIDPPNLWGSASDLWRRAPTLAGRHAASILELLDFNNPPRAANCTQAAFSGELNLSRYTFSPSKVPGTNTI